MAASEFLNKKIFITGAALGLGRELSFRFAEQGAVLFLLDKNESELKSLEAELIQQKVQVQTFVFDLTNLDELPKMFSELWESVKSFDYVVNNAGYVHGGSFIDSSWDEHHRTLKINLVACFQITQLSIRKAVEWQSPFHLIQIGSVSAFEGFPFAATYGATKAAVLNLTEAVRSELKAKNIQNILFSVICSGYIDTGMFDGVKPPMFTKLLNPQRLSHQILNTVRKRKFIYITPIAYRATLYVKALVPQFIWDFLVRAVGVHTGMDKWTGRKN